MIFLSDLKGRLKYDKPHIRNYRIFTHIMVLDVKDEDEELPLRSFLKPGDDTRNVFFLRLIQSFADLLPPFLSFAVSSLFSFSFLFFFFFLSFKQTPSDRRSSSWPSSTNDKAMRRVFNNTPVTVKTHFTTDKLPIEGATRWWCYETLKYYIEPFKQLK